MSKSLSKSDIQAAIGPRPASESLRKALELNEDFFIPLGENAYPPRTNSSNITIEEKDSVGDALATHLSSFSFNGAQTFTEYVQLIEHTAVASKRRNIYLLPFDETLDNHPLIDVVGRFLG